MKAGLQRDDIWIMVEDEFLETARQFTNHLHRAEYQRLKQLAKSQNASVTQTISRPIDPRVHLSEEARRIEQAASLAKKQHDGIAKLMQDIQQAKDADDDLDADHEDPWMRDSRLAHLMSGTQVEHTRLDNLTSTSSKTRASAGFSKPTKTETKVSNRSSTGLSMDSLRSARRNPVATTLEESRSDSEDDLDHYRPPVSKLAKISEGSSRQETHIKGQNHERIPISSSSRSYDAQNRTTSSGTPRLVTTELDRVSREKKTVSSALRASPTKSDVYDLDEPRKRDVPNSGFAARMAKRKAEMAERARAEKKKSISLDEIPTFLF